MGSRIWNVRLNVDEINAALVGLDEQAERASFLVGLVAGINGKLSVDRPGSWLAGWTIGTIAFKEAETFREKQRSNVSRRYQQSTMELPASYHGSTVELPTGYRGATTELPNDNLQSTIEESKNPKIHQSSFSADGSANEQKETVSRKRKEYPTEFESFWTSYPKGSKLQAFTEWSRLSKDERALAIQCAPRYKASCSAINRDLLDTVRFLKYRSWEGVYDEPRAQPARAMEIASSDPTHGFKAPPEMPPRLRVVS